MKNNEINIRDPFILNENGTFYLYGTRAKDFGIRSGGFDVYVGTDLENWSDPIEVFCSTGFGLNKDSNWAPELHKYRGRYYIFATFEQESGMRGTYALAADSPLGPFAPVSPRALTPEDWWSLDGTLFVENETPYLVFCHEHVQINDGTICTLKLKEDLSAPDGEPRLMFFGSDAFGCVPGEKRNYVTDGPFLYKGKNDRLYMIWSTIISGSYYQCLAVSESGSVNGPWKQLEPLFTNDGGHGMVFSANGALYLTLHSPNRSLFEHPVFFEIEDTGSRLEIRKKL